MRKLEQKFITTTEFNNFVNEYSKKNSVPVWKIAISADIHPSVLSRAVNKKVLWEPELLKIKTMAEQIGFDGECFKVLEEQTV